MQYILSEQELKELKQVDPNFHYLHDVLSSISQEIKRDIRLALYDRLVQDLDQSEQMGITQAMLDAWKQRKPGEL